MKIITYSKKSSTTARLLRDKLQELLGERILLSNRQGRNREVVINYGSGEHWITCQHNSPEFVSLCTGKYTFSNLLRENGFYVPDFRRGVPTSYPAVIRESLVECGARGLHVARNEKEYNEGNFSTNFWWTPYVRTRSEFRVHVINGEPVKVSKKLYKQQDAEESDLPIRSHLRGYYFKLIEDEKWRSWEKMVELVHKLSSVLTGTFYGLDLGFDAEKQDYFIFEANSAPGLIDTTANIYAQHLQQIIGGEHGDIRRTEENNQRT